MVTSYIVINQINALTRFFRMKSVLTMHHMNLICHYAFVCHMDMKIVYARLCKGAHLYALSVYAPIQLYTWYTKSNGAFTRFAFNQDIISYRNLYLNVSISLQIIDLWLKFYMRIPNALISLFLLLHVLKTFPITTFQNKNCNRLSFRNYEIAGCRGCLPNKLLC